MFTMVRIVDNWRVDPGEKFTHLPTRVYIGKSYQPFTFYIDLFWLKFLNNLFQHQVQNHLYVGEGGGLSEIQPSP